MRAATSILVWAMILAAALHSMPAAQEPAGRCTGAGFSGLSFSGQQDSTACLSCHDGMIATDITPSSPAYDRTDSLHNHPVRISYAQACFRDPSGFILPSMLDKRVKLVDGEVQCVSCHAVSSNGSWTTVKSNARSALCLSCHRK
ncbi:MAG TPA: hypothetical protein VK327_14000 [Candidatus Paceibacterota bacterium]|nr:hypothetical protein [Candidatus Paceibacterota bacterium]